jgi:hypothetical protein
MGYCRFIDSCKKNKAAHHDLDIPSRDPTINDTLPGYGIFKSYGRFALETRTGILDKKSGFMTKKTLRHSMGLIWSALERRTSKGIPKLVREQVHNVSLN